jgi:hypothetical protein
VAQLLSGRERITERAEAEPDEELPYQLEGRVEAYLGDDGYGGSGFDSGEGA